MKRNNPITCKPFKRGDPHEDGRIFLKYRLKLCKDGFFVEDWASPEAYHRDRVRLALINTSNTRRRGTKYNKTQRNNLDMQYLLNIFPKNNKCPALNIQLEWGGQNKDHSPSLDRIDPKKGYIKGNVQWISNKVNRVKTDQELDMVIKLGNWAERVKSGGIKVARVYESITKETT